MDRRGEWIIWLLLAALALASALRNGVWRDELTLWSDAAAKAPHKATPHLNLANALARRGAQAEAEQEYRRVLAVNPLDSRAINGLAVIWFRQERFAEAERLFALLAAEKPDEPYFRNNLGVALLRQGRLDEAIGQFVAAIRLAPGQADPRYNLGLAHRQKGELAEAAAAFSRALELNPDHASARQNLREVNDLRRSGS